MAARIRHLVQAILDHSRLFRDQGIQAPLFHELQGASRPHWSAPDASVLRHPLRVILEEWKAPRTQPSLFHYFVEETDRKRMPLSGRQFFVDLITGFGAPQLIHSLYSDTQALSAHEAVFRSRRRQARAFSMALHVSLLAMAVLLMPRKLEELPAVKETVVFLNTPMPLPWEVEGPEGGGGGGGGKNEPTPASGGRIPATSKVQLVAPDPTEPQPLLPAEDLTQLPATVVLPIELPQDESLPIGDIQAPLSDRLSSGPGSGGGIGTGRGTGIGPGEGPGVGPGSGGGMGGGSGGGIGSGIGSGIGGGPYTVGGGVREPVLIYKTLPRYTEEARKNRVEGILLLQIVVRANGMIDNAKVIRGLGFGLDESALKEVVTQWKFKPGTLNGRPVDVLALIEVSFRLL